MTIDLLPRATWFPTGSVVEVEVRSAAAVTGRLLVEHLDTAVADVEVDLPAGGGTVTVGQLPRGGYAVCLHSEAGDAETALDVLDHAFERPRYGFLSDFSPDRDDVTETVDDLRRLHLDVIQFYDWMYRHEELLGPEDEFTDALGRPTSHATTRALVDAGADAGALAMGYAAVYGVSNDYARDHEEELLLHDDGTAWMLGDFLHLVDPTPGRSWLARFGKQLTLARERMGFAGFHLDQYGWPKLAVRRDGTAVDLAETFPAMIGSIRQELPDAKLIFNNVNDFPTAATADAPQDAVYIEVWPPHDTYGDLANLIGRARSDGHGKPVILAAYLEPYADEPAPRADAAAQLAFATIAAHGGHHLLCGERGGVLVDPYYPNYHRASDKSRAVLRRLFDAAVALGDLLYDDGPVVTGSWFGGINEELVVGAPVPVSGRAEAGALWVIVRRGARGITIHLIDLTDQGDVDWNTGKTPLQERRDVQVAVSVPGTPSVAVATPVAGGRTRRAAHERDGDHVRIPVPPFRGWAVVVVSWAPR
jgi:dextranase